MRGLVRRALWKPSVGLVWPGPSAAQRVGHLLATALAAGGEGQCAEAPSVGAGGPRGLPFILCERSPASPPALGAPVESAAAPGATPCSARAPPA